MNERIRDVRQIPSAPAETSSPSPANQSRSGLPPIPTVLNDETASNWLLQVTELMDPKSGYRKRLLGVVQRHKFRVAKQGGKA